MRCGVPANNGYLDSSGQDRQRLVGHGRHLFKTWHRSVGGRTDCKRIFGLLHGALWLRAMMESARREANR